MGDLRDSGKLELKGFGDRNWRKEKVESKICSGVVHQCELVNVCWYLKYSVQISREDEFVLYISTAPAAYVISRYMALALYKIVYMGINLRKHWEECSEYRKEK